MSQNSQEEKINRWLDELEIAMEKGTPIEPEDVCDDLELLPTLKTSFKKLCRVNAFLNAKVSGDGTTDAAGISSSPKSRTIGRYKLLQKVGEGGMGTVWMAEQKEPIKRRVALKIIRATFPNKSVLARFEAERQALAMMDHQNIAKVFDAGNTETGTPYFVMELVLGIPITEYCEQKKLPIPERLALFRQVCEAIQHAHSKGIIHRDIKPSNVLVSEYEGKAVVKVIDFGIAKALQADLTDKTYFTEFGQILGTYLYMSPEQTEMNALSIDTRSDVYSLGILLYELLTGQTPISAETLATQAIPEVLKLIHQLEPPKGSDLVSVNQEKSESLAKGCGLNIDGLRSALRGDLDAIMMKATANERNRRYSTPLDLSRDVGRYLGNETVEARPPSQLYYLRKLISRHRGKVVAASIILVSLVAGIVGTSLGLAWALDEKTRADAVATKNIELAEKESTARKNAEEQVKIAKKANENLERETRISNSNLLATEALLIRAQKPSARQESLGKAIEAAELTLENDGILTDAASRALRESLIDIQGFGSIKYAEGSQLEFSPRGSWLCEIPTFNPYATRLYDMTDVTAETAFLLGESQKLYWNRWVADSSVQKVWDLEERQLHPMPEIETGLFEKLHGISPDGKWFVFEKEESKGLLVGNKSTLSNPLVFEIGWGEGFWEFDPSSRWLYKQNRGSVEFIDLDSHEERIGKSFEIEEVEFIDGFNSGSSHLFFKNYGQPNTYLRIKRNPVRFTIKEKGTRVLGFVPETSLLAVYNFENATLKLWDCNSELGNSVSGELPILNVLDDSAKVEFRSYSTGPAGKWIAFSTEKNVILWNWETNRTRRIEIEAADVGIKVGIISPGGKWLAVVSDRIDVFDLSSIDRLPDSLSQDDAIATYHFAGDPVYRIRFSPDDQFLLDTDNGRVWRLGDKCFGNEPETVCDQVGSLQFFSPNLDYFITNGGTHIDSKSKDNVQVFSLKQKQKKGILKVFDGHEEITSAATLDESLGLLVTGGKKGDIKIRRLETGKLLQEATPHFTGISSLQISPEGHVLSTGRAKLAVTDPSLPIKTGDSVASEERNPFSRFSTKPFETFTPAFEVLGPLSVDGKCRFMLTSERGRGMQLWDLKERLVQASKRHEIENVIWSKISSDAKWAVCLRTEYPSGIWDISEDRFYEIADTDIPLVGRDWGRWNEHAGFNENERYAFFTVDSQFHLVFLPDSSSGKFPTQNPIRSAGSGIMAVACDPDSGDFYVATHSGEIQKWEVRNKSVANEPEILLKGLPVTTDMRVTSGGDYLYTISNGKLQKWTLNPQLLLKQAKKIDGVLPDYQEFAPFEE